MKLEYSQVLSSANVIAQSLSLLYTTTMVNRTISHDVKLAAIQLYEHDILPLSDILAYVDFSKQTFYQILWLWHETGDVVKPHKTRLGHKCLIECEDLEFLLKLLHNNPDFFLDELLNLLKTNCFISIHYTTIHWELECAGVSCKKLKCIAIERSEAHRAEFVRRMAQYTPGQLEFLYETSNDERTWSWHFGRAGKRRRAEKHQPFVQGHWVSTGALLTIDGIVSSMAVEGSMTK